METLAPTDMVQHATDHVLAGFQHDFPVVHDDRVAGVLTHGDLVKRLIDKGGEAPVRASMTARFETSDPSGMVEAVFQRLQASACPAAPVLVGILTVDTIGPVWNLRSALHPEAAHLPVVGR